MKTLLKVVKRHGPHRRSVPFRTSPQIKTGRPILILETNAGVLKSSVGTAKKPVLESTTSTKKSVTQERNLSALTTLQAVQTKDDVDHDMRLIAFFKEQERQRLEFQKNMEEMLMEQDRKLQREREDSCTRRSAVEG